ncbi:Rv0361 family membrane protein [Mycobacterium sp. NPDC003323]
MTQYPPQQPGPWDPHQQQPQAYEYPEYPVYGAQPYGYGVPPAGYPYPYAPQPPKKSNRALWIVGGALSLLLVAALVVGGVFLLRNGDEIVISGDEAEIKQLVEDFSAAGNTGSFSDLGQYFCAAEAGMFSALSELGQILEGIEIPQGAAPTELSATNIQIKGEVASATMDSGGPFETAYFRKENGEWKVCMSAAVEFSQK